MASRCMTSDNENRFRRPLATVMLAIALILSSGAALPAAAQLDGNSYEFQSGNLVDWTSAWTYEEEYSGVDGDLESVFLSSQLGTVLVLTLPPDLDVAEIRDEVLDLLFG